MLHSSPQPVVIRGQLHHLLLRLHITHLRLVPAFTHGHVVPLAPQPVLGTAFIYVFLGFSLQHLVVVTVVAVVRARDRGRRRCGVSRLEMHGGLGAMGDLILQVRHLLVLLLLLHVPGVLLRVVVRRGHGGVHLFIVMRFLLDSHGANSLLVQWLKFGVHISRHVELLMSRTALHRIIVRVHHFQLVLSRVVMEEIGQKVVVESGRVDISAQIDGRLVVTDLPAEVHRIGVLLLWVRRLLLRLRLVVIRVNAVRQAAHQRPGRHLV